MIRTLVLALLAIASAEARDATVRFIAEQATATPGQIVMIAGKSRSQPFPLPVNSLSEPLTAPRAFELKAAEDNAALAQVTLPDAGKSFVVLLIGAGKSFQPVVLANDDKAFKGGDLYCHNSSGKTVNGKVGTTGLSLDTGKGRFVKPAGASPEKVYEVSFKVREEKGERVITETRWPVDPQLRSYVFFFTKPGTDRTDYRVVEEFVAAR